MCWEQLAVAETESEAMAIQLAAKFIKARFYKL
jgi:hypothetical protein